MATYKRGEVYWYEFNFAGQRIRESAKTTSRTLAREAERKRRRELEEGFNGVRRRMQPRLFSIASQEWLTLKTPALSPRSVAIEKTNLNHMLPVFGKLLLSDIGADDISKYQQRRLEEGASPKTVNLEVGTLRAILRRNRLWAAIQPDVRMLPVRDDVGRAISREEEERLLGACGESRSRSLLPAVTLALSTCMRYSEVRLLRREQIDFAGKTVTVGQSKTEAGTGRQIPLNDRALKVLEFWAGPFPERTPEHYVFPAEQYGAKGDKFTFGFHGACAYKTDPTKPIRRWKEAWEAARERAKVKCRFHDLRHTGCTRMLEAGVPFSVVATIMGWSAATTVRMAKRYGHIGQAAQRQAVEALSGADSRAWSPQKSPQLEEAETGRLPN